MIPTAIIDKLRNDFSNAASIYDGISNLHRDIGLQLIRKITVPGPVNILDIGMGTGYLTEKVAMAFSDSKVIGIDFAKGMANYASLNRKNIFIVCGDAEHLPIALNSMDMLISNLSLQWVQDKDRAFNVFSGILRPGGRMLATIFGKETFRELFTALEKTSRKTSFNVPRLTNSENILNKAKDNFSGVELKVEEVRVEFRSMNDLLKWIKNLGANALGRNIFIGKEHMKRAEDYYNHHFMSENGVYATMEIIWLDIKK